MHGCPSPQECGGEWSGAGLASEQLARVGEMARVPWSTSSAIGSPSKSPCLLPTAKFNFDLFDARQVRLQLLGQCIGQLVGSDTYRFGLVLQGVLGTHIVLGTWRPTTALVGECPSPGPDQSR